MSTTLYRKYRPKNFSEVIGQSHIVRTLSNSVKNSRVGHAYLFTGPRGTGKTSIARILAKTINCANPVSEGRADTFVNSCDKCPSCKTIGSGKSLDIIEIDAASNTGVDNIRELRETVALSTASLKYKVYIIDEVHMLSAGAWNALLKTLEEPPLHVIFILATTQIHKVPETIISRCQKFDFERLPITAIIKKLTLIAVAEKVKIENEALEMIAIAAEGGMRDAESLLGQIITLEDKNITVSEVEEILGAAGKKTARDLARLILEKNSASAIMKVNELLEDGYDLQVFNKTLINYLRQLMLIKIDENLKKYFSFEMPEEQTRELIELAKTTELQEILIAINLFLEAQNKISSFILPQLSLEIAIIKATRTFPELRIMNQESSEDNSKLQPKIQNLKETKGNSSPVIEQFNNTEAEKINSPASTTDISIIRQNWNKLLIGIRPFNHSLSALLSNCQPVSIKNNLLTLATPYDFYRERLNEDKNKLTLEKVFSKILGFNICLCVNLDKSLAPKEEMASADQKSPSEQNSLLDSALEIIGGKIVE